MPLTDREYIWVLVATRTGVEYGGPVPAKHNKFGTYITEQGDTVTGAGYFVYANKLILASPDLDELNAVAKKLDAAGRDAQVLVRRYSSNVPDNIRRFDLKTCLEALYG